MNKERLDSCAIMRNGTLHFGGQSHWHIRARIGEHVDGDIEGFVTSKGKFVTRKEAIKIGVEAGQLHERWLKADRALLSSNINW